MSYGMCSLLFIIKTISASSPIPQASEKGGITADEDGVPAWERNWKLKQSDCSKETQSIS